MAIAANSQSRRPPAWIPFYGRLLILAGSVMLLAMAFRLILAPDIRSTWIGADLYSGLEWVLFSLLTTFSLAAIVAGVVVNRLHAYCFVAIRWSAAGMAALTVVSSVLVAIGYSKTLAPLMGNRGIDLLTALFLGCVVGAMVLVALATTMGLWRRSEYHTDKAERFRPYQPGGMAHVLLPVVAFMILVALTAMVSTWIRDDLIKDSTDGLLLSVPLAAIMLVVITILSVQQIRGKLSYRGQMALVWILRGFGILILVSLLFFQSRYVTHHHSPMFFPLGVEPLLRDALLILLSVYAFMGAHISSEPCVKQD